MSVVLLRVLILCGALMVSVEAACAPLRMERISVGHLGQTGDAGSRKAALSPNGRWVVFLSLATNLTATPVPAERPQWYLRDRLFRTTRLVSRNAAGEPMNSPVAQAWSETAHAAISDDGRTILFDAYAPLSTADTNGRPDVYRVIDMGLPELIETPAPAQSEGNYRSALLGSDGAARRLLTHCPDSLGFETARQICTLDLETHAFHLVTGTPAGLPFDGSVLSASLSRDGRFVGMGASASNLVSPPLEPPFSAHAFVRDLAAGETRIVSVGADGQPTEASAPVFSSDGRHVIFAARGQTRPVPTLDGTFQLFMLDTLTNEYRLLSQSPQGQLSTGVGFSSISGDGRYVVFSTLAPELNPFLAFMKQFYRVELSTGEVEMISVNGDGVPALPSADQIAALTYRPMSPVLSHDGSVIAFTTAAVNLDPADDNGEDDVYVADFNPARGVESAIALPTLGTMWGLALAGMFAVTGGVLLLGFRAN